MGLSRLRMILPAQAPTISMGHQTKNKTNYHATNLPDAVIKNCFSCSFPHFQRMASTRLMSLL